MGRRFTSPINPLRNFLLKGKHIHPFVILFVDLFIVFFSFSLSYLIVGGFGFEETDFAEYLLYTASFCLVALTVIYFGRLHTGLLRYSNTTDLFNVFGATLTFTLVFLVLMLVLGSNGVSGDQGSLLLILLVNFFITASLLVAFRLLAKSTFLALSRMVSNREVHRVLIYGSDKNAV